MNFKIILKRSIIIVFLISVIFSVFIFFKVQRAADTIVVRVFNDQIINNNFYGFGAETLPWLWTEENKSSGVNEKDIRLMQERIKNMNLPITRIFVPWETWNPSIDYETFTWESDEMKSLYRTLDVYQNIGTSVIIVTVDWYDISPWKDIEGSTAAVIKLLEYLVRERGYSCIRFWTLTNEPEKTYGWMRKVPFENYIQIHRLVKDGLREKGLLVRIIASDEVESPEWFERTVKALYNVADIFSAHVYLYPEEILQIEDYFKSRLSIIKKNSRAERDIPFFLCEFGFRGSDFGVRTNNLMQEYEYGLYVASLGIDALNSGVDAASIWCLHQIRLIDEIKDVGGKMMRIGLWGYKDEDWRPFPIFYLYQLFTKYINANVRVLKTEVLPSHILKVACVEYGGKYSIFIVNLTDTRQVFLFKGITAGSDFKKYLYTNSILPFSRDNPLVLESRLSFNKSLEDEIPPMSVILYTNLAR